MYSVYKKINCGQTIAAVTSICWEQSLKLELGKEIFLLQLRWYTLIYFLPREKDRKRWKRGGGGKERFWIRTQVENV